MPEVAAPTLDYLTVDEVAAILRVTPRWIRDATRDGRLAHVKLRSQIRIKREVLDAYIAAHTVDAD